MARARRILVAAYHYPPDPSVGAHRWPAMARHLRGLGHEVTIVTTSAFGALPDDGAMTARTADIQAWRPLRRILRRPTLIDDSGALTGAPAPAVLSRGVVPDYQLVTWAPFALRRLRRLLAESRFDCMITNSRPDSAHLLGLALGPRRPAWIADFEDGWRFEPLGGPWPTRLQERIDASLERRVLSGVDIATAITQPIAEDLAERFGVRAVCVPNGLDPALGESVQAAEPPELDRQFVNLVHTGALTYPERRDPRPLLQALSRVARQPQGDGRPVRLILAGRLTTDDLRLLDTYELGDAVHYVGHLSREQAIALQRAADALVLIATGGHVSQVTGKLFEYITSGRPILAVAADNEARRIVVETNTGLTVAPDDTQGIEEALRRARVGELERAYHPRGIDRYVFPAPAESMAEVIEEAISLRHAHRRPIAAG